jgi:hypothetical protein
MEQFIQKTANPDKDPYFDLFNYITKQNPQQILRFFYSTFFYLR